jgi:hypothetical protein
MGGTGAKSFLFIINVPLFAVPILSSVSAAPCPAEHVCQTEQLCLLYSAFFLFSDQFSASSQAVRQEKRLILILKIRTGLSIQKKSMLPDPGR